MSEPVEPHDPLWQQRVMHNETRRDPWERAKAMKPAVLYLFLYQEMREKARELGYALLVHGSMNRDLDLLAVPWVDEAVEESVFIWEMCEVAGLYFLPGSNPPEKRIKPHGRMGYTLMPGGPLWVDLSVMPRLAALTPSPSGPPEGTNG